MDTFTHAQSIFFQRNLSEAIVVYLRLVNNVNSSIRTVNKEFDSAIQMFEQASRLISSNISTALLSPIVVKLNQAATIEQKERLLIIYLGLMLCYYYLGEINAIRGIQSVVAQQKLEITFWDKHGGDIKEGTMMALGALMSLASGGAVSPGAGAAAGGQTVAKENAMRKEGLIRQKRNFDALQSAIVGLQF